MACLDLQVSMMVQADKNQRDSRWTLKSQTCDIVFQTKLLLFLNGQRFNFSIDAIKQFHERKGLMENKWMQFEWMNVFFCLIFSVTRTDTWRHRAQWLTGNRFHPVLCSGNTWKYCKKYGSHTLLSLIVIDPCIIDHSIQRIFINRQIV